MADNTVPFVLTGGLGDFPQVTFDAKMLQTEGFLASNDSGAGSNPLEPDVHVGSWAQGELGRWFRDALVNYRGTPTFVRWQESEVYRAFLTAITTYDVTGAPPYPPVQPEIAQWFLNYLRKNGG